MRRQTAVNLWETNSKASIEQNLGALWQELISEDPGIAKDPFLAFRIGFGESMIASTYISDEDQEQASD